MDKLQALQERFLDYVQHADMAIAADVSGATPEERAKRLSIYFNAYRVRLRGSIETDHPVLGVYLGDDGFDQMAAAYIDRHPSSETSLRHFCDLLPDFLREHAPYSEIGVLADLATFERLLMEVFDAADAIALDRDYLSTIPAERWPELTLLLHPSVRIHVSDWNSIEIWRAIKAGRNPPNALQGDKRAWLLWRNRERLTEFRSLEIDEFSMLECALDSQNVASICEKMLEWHTEGNVAARVLSLIRDWLSLGLIVVSRTA